MKRPIAALVLGVVALGLTLSASSAALAQGSNWSLEELCSALEQGKQAPCRLDVQRALAQQAREDSEKDEDSEDQDSEKDDEEDDKKDKDEDSEKKSEEDSDKKSEEDSDKKSEEDSDKKSEEDSDDKSSDDTELPPLPELSPEPEDSDAPPLPEPPAGSVKNCQITTAPSLLGNLWIAGLLLLRRRS